MLCALPGHRNTELRVPEYLPQTSGGSLWSPILTSPDCLLHFWDILLNQASGSVVPAASAAWLLSHRHTQTRMQMLSGTHAYLSRSQSHVANSQAWPSQSPV